ncbi:MAG TPA: serine hydrolase domain-containing protein [Polyangiaceae bacterium]|nr:serine hydrolase domain-containing protein [Polyangiaceae bacterium]
MASPHSRPRPFRRSHRSRPPLTAVAGLLALPCWLGACDGAVDSSTPGPADSAEPDGSDSVDPGSDDPTPSLPDEPLAERLDAVLDAVVARGTVGAGLYLQRRGHAPYRGARGLADVATGERLTPDHLFRIASMSKTYLTAVLMKLAVEGRLAMTDPITGYLPADIIALIPDAERISIYDLLTMWSGIIDYRDLTFVEEVLFGDHSLVRDEYTDLMNGLGRNPTPCAPPEIALEQVTPERAECLYSNTNYVLAGYIADRVLYGVEPAAGVRQEHHSRAFREQLFAPLGLTATYYEKHPAPGEEDWSERLAHGYYSAPGPDGEPQRTDVTGWDDGNGFANGGLISTLEEVARFRHALFSHDHPYPMATLAEKGQFLDLLGTTNALGVAPAGATAKDAWIFSGDIGGYTSWVQYSPTRDTVFAFMSNDRDLEPTRGDVIAEIQAILDSASY